MSLVLRPRVADGAPRRGPRAQASRLRNGARQSQNMSMPFALGFAFLFPVIAVLFTGLQGSVKWIDNFGIQILIYIMLGLGLNIVVGLAGLLDLGYVAFYAVGAYSYALLAKTFGFSFWILLPLVRNPGRVLGHPARISGAAAARRLSRHRDDGIRRNHPPRPDQLGRSHQRLCRHQRHPASDLFRHSVQCQRRRLRRRFRTGIFADLSHDLSLLRHPVPRRC